MIIFWSLLIQQLPGFALQTLPLVKNLLTLPWLLDAASVLPDHQISLLSSATWVSQGIAQEEEKRQYNMMIRKLVTILPTIIFSILIAFNGRLAMLTFNLLRSGCARLESLSERVHYHRRSLNSTSLLCHSGCIAVHFCLVSLLLTIHTIVLLLPSKTIHIQVLLWLHNSKPTFKMT